MTDLIRRFWAKTVIIKSIMKQSRHNPGRQVTKELNIAKFGSFSVLSVMCTFIYSIMESQKQLKLCRFPQRTCKLMRLKVVI